MNLSPSLEDYLETILVLQEEGKKVRVKDIASNLEVKRQSVIDAVKLLKERSLVKQERYSFIELTNNGSKIAKSIIKKHKLIKNFLQLSLGLDEDTADRDACKIEHYLSPKTIKLMSQKMKNN